jgi:hypothetical protein
MYRWGVELTPNQRRVPVTEAADALGISEGAVRMRVKRGTLPSTREDGRLYVLLNTEPTPEPGRPHVRTHDRTSELIATLREQLQAERQAHSEARRLLAAALERIPAIEARQETSEATEAAEEQQGRGKPHSATGGAQRRAYRGRGGASSYGGDGTMQEEREERTKKMAEELSKLQQIHAHLSALEQMAASYPENHSTRLAIESLELYKARTVVEGDIVRLRGSLGYGTTGYGTL